MRYHIDLAEARRRAIPIIERPDRNLASDCRVEAGTSPLAAARRDLYIAKQAVDGCRADGKNAITIRLAKLQSPVLFERGQQSRDHHLEPLAAYPIGRLPQSCQRILGRRAVSAPA